MALLKSRTRADSKKIVWTVQVRLRQKEASGLDPLGGGHRNRVDSLSAGGVPRGPERLGFGPFFDGFAPGWEGPGGTSG